MYEKKTTHNLAESKHFYNNGSMTFHFSRDFNYKRFIKQRETFTVESQYKFQAQHGVKISVRDFFDVVLYFQIEKVGTYIVNNDDGGVITCRELVELNGTIKTLEKSTELLRTTTHG